MLARSGFGWIGLFIGADMNESQFSTAWTNGKFSGVVHGEGKKAALTLDTESQLKLCRENLRRVRAQNA